MRLRGLLEGTHFKSLIARILALAFIVSTIYFLPQPVDARVCPDGTISDGPCKVEDCNNADDPLGCYPEPPVPSPLNCNEELLSLHPPATVKGSVVGPQGEAVGNVCIYWVDGETRASTLTNSSGEFAINVRADSVTVTVYASKAFMTYDFLEVVPLEHIQDSTKRVNYQIAYTNSGSIQPWAINSTQDREVSISMYSAAPTSTALALVELESQVVSLPYDPSYELIYEDMIVSRWKGTATVSAGLSEGYRRYDSCLVSGGTCDDPQDTILSPVPPDMFRISMLVDNTPPQVAPGFPKSNRNTLETTPYISPIASDALSGIAGGELFVDGHKIADQLSSYATLGLGVHTVTSTARDLAGNSTSVSWSFDVTSLNAAAATLTVTPKSTYVNPEPHPLLYRPTYVRVEGIKGTLGSHELTLSSSSLWAGKGSVQRQVAHPDLRATFQNELGQSVTVNAPSAWGIHTYRIAALLPSSTPLVTTLEQNDSLFSVDVPLPPAEDFIATDASTVTVWAEEAVVQSNGGHAPGADPLSEAITVDDVPVITISRGATTKIAGSGTDVSASTVQGRLEVHVDLNGERLDLLDLRANYGGDPPVEDQQSGKTFNEEPDLYCSGVRSQSYDCLYYSNTLSYSRAYSFGARPLGFGLYANHWVSRATDTATYLTWSQIGTVLDRSECSSNRRSSIVSLLSGESSVSQSLVDPATARSPWKFDLSVGSDEQDASTLVSLPWGNNHHFDQDDSFSAAADLTLTSPFYDGLGAHVSSLKIAPKLNSSIEDRVEKVIHASRLVRDLAATDSSADSETLNINFSNLWKVQVRYEVC